MAKYIRSLFSSSNRDTGERKKAKSKTDLSSYGDNGRGDEDNKEFSAPFDTKRKCSISKSGRMKQNLKVRGNLGKDLFGEEIRHEETQSKEYHVFGKNFSNEQRAQKNISKSTGNLDNAQINGWIEDTEDVAIRKKQSDQNKQKEEEDFVDIDEKIDCVFKPVLVETML